MFHMPMSSPMMNRMLGFLSAASAGATTPKSAAVAISSNKPLCIMFRFILGFLLFGFGFVLMIRLRSYWLCLFSEEQRAARFSSRPLSLSILGMAIDYSLGWCL